MTQILLVDDHALFRTALSSVLNQTPDIQVVGEAANGEAALEKARELTPDLILMDIKMPDMDGIEATRRLSQQCPNSKVLMLTALDKSPYPSQALEAGASGFVAKSCQAEELYTAIRTLMVGNRYLSNEVAKSLALSRIASQNPAQTALQKLSAREMQVMLMIIKGDSNQTICDALFLSPKTISTYRHRLYIKLDVKNDVELTHFALHHDII